MRYSLCMLKWKKIYVEKCSIQCFLHLFAHNNIGRYIKLFCKQQKRSSAPKNQPISIHFIIWKGKKSSVFTESFLSSLYVLLKWKKYYECSFAWGYGGTFWSLSKYSLFFCLCAYCVSFMCSVLICWCCWLIL